MMLTGKKTNSDMTKNDKADITANNSVIVAGPSANDSIEIKS